jgi:hypothetical protein
MVHGLLLALLLVAGCGNAAHDVAPARKVERKVERRAIELAISDGKPAATTTLPSAAKRARLPRPGGLHGR